jgi:hypothetical protein
MDWSLKGFRRSLAGAIDPGSTDENRFALNPFNEQFVAQGGASYENIVASGRAFEINTGMTTALDLAAVILIPTTAVMLAIYNNEPEGGRSYVIDRVTATHTTAAASLSHASIIGVLGTTRVAAPTDATPAGALRALNGMGGTDTRVRSVVATTIDAVTGVAANWMVLSDSRAVGVTSLPSVSIVGDIDGRIIVPPGRYFGIHVFASAVGHEFNGSIQWHERVLALG